MKSHFITILFFIGCSIGFTANAAPDSNTDITVYDCSKSKNQHEMDTCRETGYNKATKQLASLVKKLTDNYAKNEPKLKPVFLEAQEKWEIFINSECDFQNYYSRGGSGYNTYFLHCMELHTLKRIKQLKYVLDRP